LLVKKSLSLAQNLTKILWFCEQLPKVNDALVNHHSCDFTRVCWADLGQNELVNSVTGKLLPLVWIVYVVQDVDVKGWQLW
jgi:hypothetical protein